MLFQIIILSSYGVLFNEKSSFFFIFIFIAGDDASHQHALPPACSLLSVGRVLFLYFGKFSWFY